MKTSTQFKKKTPIFLVLNKRKKTRKIKKTEEDNDNM